MEKIYRLSVQSDPDVSAIDSDLIVIPFSHRMHDQRTVRRALEGVDGTGFVDRRIVWSGQLVDLYLEAEVDADVGGVVVAFVCLGSGKPINTPKLSSGARASSIAAAIHTGGRRPRKPEKAEIRPDPSLQRTPSNPKGAGVVSPGWLLIVDIVQSPSEMPSNKLSKPAAAANGRGAMMRSPVRRDSAIPVSIGFGRKPILGKSAGPAAYRFSVW